MFFNSIRNKLVTFVFMAILMVQVINSATQYFNSQAMYIDNQEKKALTLVTTILPDIHEKISRNTDPVSFVYYYARLKSDLLFPGLLQQVEYLNDIQFISTDGTVIAGSSTGHAVPSQLLELVQQGRTGTMITDDAVIVFAPLHHNAMFMGGFLLYYSKVSIDTMLEKIIRQTAWLLVVYLFISFVFTLLIASVITKPIKQLAQASNRIAEGELDKAIMINSKDEIGDFAQSFETMRQSLYQNQIELGQLRNFLSNIINSMPSVLIGVDVNCRITLWNKAAEKTTGIPADEAHGENIIDIFPQIATEMQKVTKSIEHRKIEQEQKKPRLSESGTCYEDVTVYPLIDNGVEGAVIRIDDVTKEYELEDQLNQSRKMDAIGQLAGGVAHDFNNMLGGILGAAQLLKHNKRNLDERGLKYVDLIIQASLRAADLTSKLLTFGRKSEIVVKVEDVHSIIDDTVAILSRTVDKRIIISLKKNAKNPIIKCDRSGLLNSLLNIGINASQAIPGGGKILIETRNVYYNEMHCDASPFEIDPGEFIEIEVRDSGSGIPLANLQRIFEPFFTTKEQGEGTGLGLAAVYGTVKEHHGTISVYSEEGVGTSFHISLPCSEKGSDDLRIDAEIVAGTGLILLVDDEEFIRIVGKHMLEDMGYKVMLAENGLEAFEVFQKHAADIDAIVMDLIMPKMDGRETFEKIRAINENCKIIISSGFAKDENLKDLTEMGLAGFIRKPFRDFELSQILAKVLKT